MMISCLTGIRASYLKGEYMRQGLQFKIKPYSFLSFSQLRKAKSDPDNDPYLVLIERLRKAHILNLLSFCITVIFIVLSFIIK